MFDSIKSRNDLDLLTTEEQIEFINYQISKLSKIKSLLIKKLEIENQTLDIINDDISGKMNEIFFV